MQTEHAVCWGAEFPLSGETEVAWVLWQVPSHLVSDVGLRPVRGTVIPSCVLVSASLGCWVLAGFCWV